jgi:hypothetical protein
MHKLFKALLVMVLIMGLTIPALAKEVKLDVTVDSMVEKTDKNGNQYVRFIAIMDKQLEGTSYQTGVPIMAFGAAVEQARNYKAGDQLKVIAKYREWNSTESYTILAYIE